MIRFSYALALFSTLFFLGGCKNPSIYYWGNYEEQIYGMYAAPDQVTAEAQIDVLLADQEKARSKNKPLPPGFHAHLGFLYFQLGRIESRCGWVGPGYYYLFRDLEYLARPRRTTLCGSRRNSE